MLPGGLVGVMSTNDGMTHIAIQESLNGKSVLWVEKVRRSPEQSEKDSAGSADCRRLFRWLTEIIQQFQRGPLVSQ
jgi:hypothetical protein